MNIKDLTTMPKLVQALRDLIWEADQNFGEVSDEAMAQWEAIDEKIEIKAENTVKFIQELEASSKMYKERAKGLTDHARQTKNTADRLRKGLIYFLDKADKRQCPTPLFPKLSVRLNQESLFVTDERALFAKKMMYKRLGYLELADPKILKNEIKAALKLGKKIDGVELGRTEKIYW